MKNTRYVSASEVIDRLETDIDFLHRLDAEEIIHLERRGEHDLVLSERDAERVRLVLLLTTDLDVNIAGAEMVIRMRETMVDMQRQFLEILDALSEEMRRRGPR